MLRPHIAVPYMLLVFAMASGCTNRNTAEAYLQINRDLFDGSFEDFQSFTKTQARLLRSDFILNCAVNRAVQSEAIEGTSRQAVRDELRKNLRVELPRDAQLILVRFSSTASAPEQIERILDAVIDTYEKEIVNKERLELVEELSRLRTKYQEAYDAVVKEADSVEGMRRKTGSWKTSPTDTIYGEMGKTKLVCLQQTLVDLQVEKSGMNPETSRSDGSELAKINRKIAYVDRQIEDYAAEQSKPNTLHGTLEARSLVLEGLKDSMSQIQAKKTELEIKLSGRQRIQVIQHAYVKTDD